MCQAVCGELLPRSHGLPLKVDWHLIKAAYILTCSLSQQGSADVHLNVGFASSMCHYE